MTRINGHDNDEILKALKTKTDKPHFIIADTIKGKGVSYMENLLLGMPKVHLKNLKNCKDE